MNVLAAPPTDPLGPVAQDPEAIRIEACKLVASDASCTTATSVQPDTPNVQASPPGFELVALLLWVALFAGLVAVVVVVARAVARRERTASDDDEDDDAPAVTVDEAGTVTIVDRRREPVDWRAEADRHRGAGRYRDALRCRYRALVGDLARRGLIDEIPGRTTGEERAQLHDVAPVAAPVFDRAADVFDAVWYGDEPAAAADDDAFVALEHDVLTATAPRPRA